MTQSTHHPLRLGHATLLPKSTVLWTVLTAIALAAPSQPTTSICRAIILGVALRAIFGAAMRASTHVRLCIQRRRVLDSQVQIRGTSLATPALGQQTRTLRFRRCCFHRTIPFQGSPQTFKNTRRLS